MALPIRFSGARQGFIALGIEVPFWSEAVGIVTEYGPVVVAMPYIGHARRAFWDKHALVPVIFCCLVRQSAFDGRPPTKHLFDSGAHIRKLWGVCERRETRTADHDINFGLRSVLHFGESHHRKCPPHKRARSGVKTCATETHHDLSFLA
jgi:hypothetical protein